MKLWRENEGIYETFLRFGIALIGTAAEKRNIEKNDAIYFKDKAERLAREEAAIRKQDRLNRIQVALEAKAERQKQRAERALERVQELKERKQRLAHIAKAKAFVKAKKLRKVRRSGRTVYVNQDNDIVNYAILAYILSSNSSSSDDSGYSYHSSSSSDDSSSFSSSDWGGSFSGGDSGGGGASGSW